MLVYVMQCNYMFAKVNHRCQPRLRRGLKHTERAGGGIVGNPVICMLLACHAGPGVQVYSQGSYNTRGVSGPDGSPLHTTTWRSEHRDKGQTHTTHSESEGAQDLLGGTVTDISDWKHGQLVTQTIWQTFEKSF